MLAEVWAVGRVSLGQLREDSLLLQGPCIIQAEATFARRLAADRVVGMSRTATTAVTATAAPVSAAIRHRQQQQPRFLSRSHVTPPHCVSLTPSGVAHHAFC